MRRVVMVVCAALLFVPIYIKSLSSQKLSARPAFSFLSSGRAVIKVSGDVRHPGIYEVPANCMTVSVIQLAMPVKPLAQGGVHKDATLPLVNGQSFRVDTRADGTSMITAGVMTVSERMVLGLPLNISEMNEADFDRLPGIGPAMAKRIVMHRHKNGGVLHFNDLTEVEGIGEKKLEQIRKYVQPAVTKD